MAIRVTAIDRTGAKKTPGTVCLTGKLTRAQLQAKVLQALGLVDFFGAYRVEVKDENGRPTTRITEKCIIFVSLNENPLEGLSDIFRNFLEKGR